MSQPRRIAGILSQFCFCFVFVALCGIARAQTDPLPSWNDTAPKKVITAFVERTTKEGSPDFVPADERIATFETDTVYNQRDAEGFIKLNALRLRLGQRPQG